jgi:D-psicose/D-tagatose/L-ribulose 3-epimerase
MKYGAHIFLWIERWTSGTLSLFDKAKNLGLDVLEIAVGDDVEFDANAVLRTSLAVSNRFGQAQNSGMEIVISPGGEWPMEADISHDSSTNREFGLSWHKHWIEQAGAAGAIAYTGAIYAHPGRIECRPESEDELKWAAENLHELANFAAPKGVKLVIEPMSHFRTSLINTPEQAVKLLEMADHPNLQVLFDTYHMVTEIRDFAKALELLSPHLWGIHACENERGVPGGGIVPWQEIFLTSEKVGFNGYIIMESYNSSIPGFARSRGMFQNICPDGDEFVKQGLKFLKEYI